jgi:probable rRNA maturation factor
VVTRNSRKGSALKRAWKIHLSMESRKLGIPSTWIRKLLKEVLGHVESDIAIPEVHEIHLALTDDSRIRVLNREHRKKDKATDVLSFPQFHPKEISGRSKRKVLAPSPYLGDLVISTETTLKQANEFGVTKRAELARLIVHGVLHLCGYDHEKVPAAEAQRMRRRERYIRGKLSVT